MSYELANCTAQALGAEWLKSDPQFLRLLATLSSGRLRVILDKPAEAKIPKNPKFDENYKAMKN